MTENRRNTDQQILELINKLDKKIDDHANMEIKDLHDIKSKDVSVMEKHAQTILVSIITASIIFMATFMYSNNRQTGELALKLEFVSSQLIELKQKMEFMATNYVTKPEFSELEQRVRVLEMKKR